MKKRLIIIICIGSVFTLLNSCKAQKCGCGLTGDATPIEQQIHTNTQVVSQLN